MFVIENGFTYIAFLMFLCGGLLALQKYAKWKIFDIMPPLVWIYLIGMIAAPPACSIPRASAPPTAF